MKESRSQQNASLKIFKGYFDWKKHWIVALVTGKPSCACPHISHCLHSPAWRSGRFGGWKPVDGNFPNSWRNHSRSDFKRAQQESQSSCLHPITWNIAAHPVSVSDRELWRGKTKPDFSQSLNVLSWKEPTRNIKTQPLALHRNPSTYLDTKGMNHCLPL